jgi:hypothetical protein
MTDTFGALVGVDDVNLIALGNRFVGTFGQADVAIDAFVRDHQGHEILRAISVFSYFLT